MSPLDGSLFVNVRGVLISFPLLVVALGSTLDCEPGHDGGLVTRAELIDPDGREVNSGAEEYPVLARSEIRCLGAFGDGLCLPTTNNGGNRFAILGGAEIWKRGLVLE